MFEIISANRVNAQDVSEILTENQLSVKDIGSHVEFLAKYQEKQIIAVAGMENYKPYALLRSVAVKRNFQKTGIGTQMVIKMIDYLTAKGITDIYLLTTTASEFFFKIGFVEINRNEVPAVISKTKEFSDICPDSATCMFYSTL